MRLFSGSCKGRRRRPRKRDGSSKSWWNHGDISPSIHEAKAWVFQEFGSSCRKCQKPNRNGIGQADNRLRSRNSRSIDADAGQQVVISTARAIMPKSNGLRRNESCRLTRAKSAPMRSDGSMRAHNGKLILAMSCISRQWLLRHFHVLAGCDGRIDAGTSWKAPMLSSSLLTSSQPAPSTMSSGAWSWRQARHSDADDPGRRHRRHDSLRDQPPLSRAHHPLRGVGRSWCTGSRTEIQHRPPLSLRTPRHASH